MLKLTAASLRRMWPKAPQPIIDAFLDQQDVLAKAGILDSPTRLAYCFANLAHEAGDWTIPRLTENINYTHARVAQVWPNRYGSASEVMNAFGSAPGWQTKLFDVIYGNRMGNRPGTSDGSRYIGRGGPQITGRDGYQTVGGIAGLDLVSKPELACLPEHQPAIAAAFWSWKKMNGPADAGDFRTCVVRWNGGTNGMADRQVKLARILPVAKSLGTQTSAPAPKPKPPVVRRTVETTVAVSTFAGLWAWLGPVVAISAFAAIAAFIAYRIWKKRKS